MEISSRFGCRCYGAEPHPALYSRIRQSDRVSVLNCAIAPLDAQLDSTYPHLRRPTVFGPCPEAGLVP